jgi:hypothetical protein
LFHVIFEIKDRFDVFGELVGKRFQAVGQVVKNAEDQEGKGDNAEAQEIDQFVPTNTDKSIIEGTLQ